MPFADFLYGPRRDARSILRPTTVDTDTIRELAETAKRYIDNLDYPNNGPATVSYGVRGYPNGGGGATISADDLEGLSSHDRNTLRVFVDRGVAAAGMQFGAGTSDAVWAQVDGNFSQGNDLRRQLEDIILDNGEPIWRAHMYLHLLPIAASALFVLLWVWLVLSTPLALPAVLLGWMVSIGVVGGAVWWSSKILEQARLKLVRHRVRDESRATTFARRANEKRDAKVMVWTFLITAAVSIPGGFVLAVLTNAFGLKG